MADRVRFEVGSATALPFPDASFDLALLLHVGMNVPDKAALSVKRAVFFAVVGFSRSMR
jgi:ubiquinone/menaquinone biosynthesis C-methylase UbiE